MYMCGAEQDMQQAGEQGSILQMVRRCHVGMGLPITAMWWVGSSLAKLCFSMKPRNFSFQILAVVDCKKWTQVIPLPLSKPLSRALSHWIWVGLETHFGQQDISKKGCKQRLEMCLHTRAWLLAAHGTLVPIAAVKKVGQTLSRSVWPRHLCCPRQQHATCQTNEWGHVGQPAHLRLRRAQEHSAESTQSRAAVLPAPRIVS